MSWTKISSPRPKKNRNTDATKAAIAQAGLDLFLSSFVDDGINLKHREPHHPAVAPNLGSIPEEHELLKTNCGDSQAIVIIGGALHPDGTLSPLVKKRIEKSFLLYNKITQTFKESNSDSHCYVVSCII